MALETFLADCYSYYVCKDHIYDGHIINPRPTASYFTIRARCLFALIYSVLELRQPPTWCKREGPNKLIVWIDCDSIVGRYRRLDVFTSVFAIVITKKNGTAIVKTAYPDGISTRK